MDSETLCNFPLFKVDLIFNCMGEEVWVYYLPRPITEEFEDFIRCFGKLKYPLGEGFSFIELETDDFLLTGNIGLKELRLTVKHTATINIKEEFEKQLTNYLRR
jgi:hypothetical protein